MTRQLFLVVHVLGFDGKSQSAALAIHIHDFGFHGVADTEHNARIIDTINADISRLQVALNLIGSLMVAPLASTSVTVPVTKGATVVVADVGENASLFQLLDTQRNALRSGSMDRITVSISSPFL
ncbi:MAG: hypothetical protein CM15mP89_2310 [Gammaproteobacteria bacterium]|nr:MAG: hypothetical protein CM15mP89_2310 [Gammaproteobacteria bacterium]